MKNKLNIVWFALLTLVMTGCGPSREEIEARERARLEAEKQAQQEIKISNDAVNTVSKELGRKTGPLDLNLPPVSKKETTPKPTKQP